MIIKLNGETTLDKLPEIISGVIKDIQERASINAAEYVIRDLQTGVLFDLGETDKKILEVEHDGITEVFTVNIQLNKEGDIIKTVDNEEKTFLDGYTRAVTKGELPPAQEPIKSIYKKADLELLKEENGGDLKVKYFKHKKNNEVVIQYFRKNKLVGETAAKMKKDGK